MCFPSTVVTVTLLLSLTGVALSSDDCVHSTKTLSSLDLHTILGKWIMHEAYALSSVDIFSHILKTTNSSEIEFTQSDNNRTVIFKQSRMRDESCTRFSVNFTVVGNKIQHTSTSYNSTADAVFLKSCGECLLMRYNTVNRDGQRGTYLLFYKRTKALSQADHEKLRAQAKCLGFTDPPEFIYTQAELCSENNEAPQAKQPEQ